MATVERVEDVSEMGNCLVLGGKALLSKHASKRVFVARQPVVRDMSSQLVNQ